MHCGVTMGEQHARGCAVHTIVLLVYALVIHTQQFNFFKILHQILIGQLAIHHVGARDGMTVILMLELICA